MGGLSAFHWLIVLVVVLLLFGNRLPSVMRSLGRGMVEFKKGMDGVGDETDGEPKAKPEADRPKEEPGK
jgi:sec-independent protein translocase protein TatA